MPGPFIAFDPRVIIRNKICTTFDIDGDGKDEYILTVGDIKVPIYLTEESKINFMPNMPFIIFDMLTSPSQCYDICAATRKHEPIIDVHIYFANIDDIDIVTFGNILSNTFVNLIRQYQSTTSGIDFMNVRDEGRIMPETSGIFHRQMELYVVYHDNIP